MEQIGFSDRAPNSTKLDQLSREELAARYGLLESEYLYALKEIYRLKSQRLTDEQLQLVMSERLAELANDMFGSSSEKYKKSEKPQKAPEPPKPRVKRPSERYPNVPVREETISMAHPPSCVCCGDVMSDSGMTEDAEQLTVIAKKYEIVLQKRAKYCCRSCHGDLQTAPAPPRIVEGGTYSDEMIVDVALSKYCDLIPIERYAQMAARSGVKDIPPQSLIDCTHRLADFLISVYLSLKNEILTGEVLAADETPHKMLEGSEKKSWHLWGFSTPQACYFECRDTRSGDVASEILQYANCRVLLSDVYSGYAKALREANAIRLEKGLRAIAGANCNAHARRYFFKALAAYPRSAFYLDQYVEIYRLNGFAQGLSLREMTDLRLEMRPYFENMRAKIVEDRGHFPEKSKIAKAFRYFEGNYAGLTLCLSDPEIPIDNNSQERLFRAPVVGRKTWYGTHSERGARTAAILFSIVESCKLNQVNPREYFPHATAAILARKYGPTPADFKKLKQGVQGPSPPA